jgi:hypothetical protein
MPTTFYPVRDTIVKAALRLVNAYSSMGNPDPAQMEDATEACNIMLKSWQIEGELWLKKFALLTLIPGQATYLLGMAQDGTPSPDVCVYTDNSMQIDRPTRVTSAAYRNSSGFDRPLLPFSREDYMRMTNKTTQAPCNQFYYNPQLYQGALTFWPVPDAADKVLISCDRGIYDLINDTDTYDVPQEWLRLCKWGLACEIAPEYAIPAGDLARMEAKYSAMKESISSYNREPVNTQIQVEY